MKLILASQSPRRREILAQHGLTFIVMSADADEALPQGVHPQQGVALLAERKGAAVAPLCSPEDIILSSDTLVELCGVPLGKPTDAADARRMLRALSGCVHRVHTGVAVRRGEVVYSDTATTAVRFLPLSDEQIEHYVASGEPMDKAGAYGIQGAAGAFVASIEGDLDTVIGLSYRLTEQLLRRIGYPFPEETTV